MFDTEYETETYAFDYESLHGVAQFRHKESGETTLLITGSDCQDERRTLRRLEQKTSSKRYPQRAPSFTELMDSYAGEFTYSN